MLANYLKIAVRNLLKHKLYGSINIFGLAIGIACCILIALFVRQEFSYDRFHENGDRIYRMEEIRYLTEDAPEATRPFWDTSAPEGVWKSAYLPMPLGPLLSEDYPEVERVVRADQSNALVRRGEIVFEESILAADAGFFEMFSFPLVQGSPGSVLDDPGKMVLTRELARKYFGEEDPVGKEILIKSRDEERPFTVSGIAEAPPSNSSIRFSLVVPFETKPGYELNRERWNSFNTPLFVQLSADASVEAFEMKVNEFVNERYAESMARTRTREGLSEDAKVLEFQASPLTGIHLDASVSWDNASNPLYSYILSGIALLILVIASINYITLALTRSSERALEVGVRKASGAGRGQLALQFWGETQLQAVAAAVVGLLLAMLLLPLFNELAGRSLSLSFARDAGILAVILGIVLLTGVAAGGYPALVLSRFKPVAVLKGNRTYRFRPRFTRVLLVFQYGLSVFLIIGSLVMYRQLDFVTSRDLGYEREQLVTVPTHTGWTEEGTLLMQRYRQALGDVPGVVDVTGMAPAFTTGSNRYGFEVDGEYKRSYIYYVDPHFIETMGMQLVAGRDFSEDRPSDIPNSVIVNEALVSSMGWKDPMGQTLPWKGEENPSTVIGVVADFHYQSLEVAVEPMLLHMDPEQGGVNAALVRIRPDDISGTLADMRSRWAEVAPTTPFDYWFMDDAVEGQYASYSRWMSIMGYATVIAILIACMGLFGLAGLTAVNRTKEIGIRKALGAGMGQIMVLLNRDLVGLIAVSLLIAAPFSWYVMDRWLEDFAYRITITPGIYLIAGFGTIAVALLTVSWQSLRAANTNPAEALRSE